MRKYQLTFPVKAIFPPVSENLLSEVSSGFCKAIVFPRSVYGLPATMERPIVRGAGCCSAVFGHYGKPP